MKNVPDRLIPLDGTHNMRDLGGYPRRGGGITAWRALLRADGLHRMTAASIETLAEMGIATIVDLRGSRELGLHPNPFSAHPSIAYRNIPLFDALAPIPTADPAFDMASRYRQAVDRCGDRIAEVLTVIADAAAGAVVFHCTAGKDRTGIIAALLLLIAGVPDECIVEDYALTATMAGALLIQLRDAALAGGATAEGIGRILASDAETMRQLLGHIQVAHGGIEAYLSQIGLSETTVSGLLRRLVV